MNPVLYHSSRNLPSYLSDFLVGTYLKYTFPFEHSGIRDNPGWS